MPDKPNDPKVTKPQQQPSQQPNQSQDAQKGRDKAMQDQQSGQKQR